MKNWLLSNLWNKNFEISQKHAVLDVWRGSEYVTLYNSLNHAYIMLSVTHLLLKSLFKYLQNELQLFPAIEIWSICAYANYVFLIQPLNLLKPLHKKWSFPLRISSVDLVTFIEETFDGKLHFLCSVTLSWHFDNKQYN